LLSIADTTEETEPNIKIKKTHQNNISKNAIPNLQEVLNGRFVGKMCKHKQTPVL
jgi:hypothetical protein